jgi:hypothetical protein
VPNAKSGHGMRFVIRSDQSGGNRDPKAHGSAAKRLIDPDSWSQRVDPDSNEGHRFANLLFLQRLGSKYIFLCDFRKLGEARKPYDPSAM